MIDDCTICQIFTIIPSRKSQVEGIQMNRSRIVSVASVVSGEEKKRKKKKKGIRIVLSVKNSFRFWVLVVEQVGWGRMEEYGITC